MSHREPKQMKEITVDVTQQDGCLNLVLMPIERQVRVFVFYGGSVKNCDFHTDLGEQLNLRAFDRLERVRPFV